MTCPAWLSYSGSMRIKRAVTYPLAVISLLCSATASWAADCGEESPTMLDGGSLHEEAKETILSGPQQANVERMLRAFDGNWEGTGQAVFCLGSEGNTRQRVRNYTIEADGNGSANRGVLELALDHERGTTNERLRLILDDGRLKLRDNIGGIEVISASANTLEYLHRFRSREGRIANEIRWRVSVTGHGITRRIVAEHWLYTLGGLGSAGIWELRHK